MEKGTANCQRDGVKNGEWAGERKGMSTCNRDYEQFKLGQLKNFVIEGRSERAGTKGGNVRLWTLGTVENLKTHEVLNTLENRFYKLPSTET